MGERRYLDRENEGPVKQRYTHLSVAREPFLAKARKCAELTIPSLIPPEGNQNPAEFKTPYQSVGARGVNNLSAKLMLTLFPPNAPFFRLTVGQYELQKALREEVALPAIRGGMSMAEARQLMVEQEQTIHQELEKSLAAVERAAMREFELGGNRPTDSEALKHLIVAGSVLRFCPPNDKAKSRIYTLANHVVKRDPDGTVLEMITKEGVSPLSIPAETREACGIAMDDEAVNKRYDLFTRIQRMNDESGEYWAVDQELNGVTVPGSEGQYEIDECPWLALRWIKVDGEDYGRSHVEEYLGDLISLEGLSQALLEGAIAAARCLVMVNPNAASGTKLKDVARAKNGAVIPGKAEDVTFLRSDKYHDLRTPAEQIQKLTQDLGHAFLLTSAVQRDAERVTAQEVRLMAQELETALGGVYTTLAQEYQLPVVTNLIVSMQKRGSLPELPAAVKPVILTGMDALGRNSEYQRLVEWLNVIRALPQPEEVAMRIDYLGLMNRLSASLGVNTDGLLLPEEQVQAMKQQMAQAAQMQAVMQSLGPEALKAGTAMMQQKQLTQTGT